jgi:adenosylcobyric acid synthase
MALLTPEERGLIKGIIINKFRGDPQLFEEGRKMLEELCQVPVAGVLPYYRDIFIEEEDSIALRHKKNGPVSGKVNVAVVLLNRLSNFTDFDRLWQDPRVNLFYTLEPAVIVQADIIILPGSKNTLEDLIALQSNGAADAICEAFKNQKTVIGICGGYQMMGEQVEDPLHVETGVDRVAGLGLLPVRTVMQAEKTTRQRTFRFKEHEAVCQGYEIHMGTTRAVREERPLNRFPDGGADGYLLNDQCWGTYLHGILDNPAVVNELVAPYTTLPEEVFDYRQYREEQYDKLAALIRRHIDMETIYKTLQS